MFGNVGVVFKGSGFYNTDYGTAKRKREQDASKKDGAKPAKTESGSSSDSGSKSSDSGSNSKSGSTSSDSSSTSAKSGS